MILFIVPVFILRIAVEIVQRDKKKILFSTNLQRVISGSEKNSEKKSKRRIILEKLDQLFSISKSKDDNKIFYIQKASIFFGSVIQLCFNGWILIEAFSYDRATASQYFSVVLSTSLILFTAIGLLDLEGFIVLEEQVLCVFSIYIFYELLIVE